LLLRIAWIDMFNVVLWNYCAFVSWGSEFVHLNTFIFHVALLFYFDVFEQIWNF
jgi:hypothetical protein